MSFGGASVWYERAMNKPTLHEAIDMIIEHDALNWALHGEAILSNFTYVFNHVKPRANAKKAGVQNVIAGAFAYPHGSTMMEQ